MTRKESELFICDTYNTVAEYLWERYPTYAVFRHTKNKKWFAIIMNVPKEKLGVNEDGEIDILNVKCESVAIGGLLKEKGFFPAYHMNKSNWISIALDGSVSDDKIKGLLDISYELVDTKKKARWI